MEREKVAIFSTLSLIVYAPKRLILNKPLSVLQPVSFQHILSLGLTIGVVKGRNYGEQLDSVIAENTDRLYLGAGSNKAERFEVMLKQGKLDGIVEYSSAFRSRQTDAQIGHEFFIYALKEAHEVVRGFLACTNSEVGKQFIGDFEQVMQSDDYRAFVIAGLNEASNYIESAYIIEQLGYK